MIYPAVCRDFSFFLSSFFLSFFHFLRLEICALLDIYIGDIVICCLFHFRNVFPEPAAFLLAPELPSEQSDPTVSSIALSAYQRRSADSDVVLANDCRSADVVPTCVEEFQKLWRHFGRNQKRRGRINRKVFYLSFSVNRAYLPVEFCQIFVSQFPKLKWILPIFVVVRFEEVKKLFNTSGL